jgi:hypothetical protein
MMMGLALTPSFIFDHNVCPLHFHHLQPHFPFFTLHTPLSTPTFHSPLSTIPYLVLYKVNIAARLLIWAILRGNLGCDVVFCTILYVANEAMSITRVVRVITTIAFPARLKVQVAYDHALMSLTRI